jgi:1-acyl-sn-glycerol-3-phosphate acyltransferase
MKGRANIADAEANPSISPRWHQWFTAYVRRYLARHFHAVLLSRQSAAEFPPGAPVIAYLNHASWWDPLTCLLLADAAFPGRRSFAPMDEAQLARYGVFRKLGMFGVAPGTARGAKVFLRVGARVLSEPDSMLWVTPQGRFADARERPLRFAGGLAALARRVPHAWLLPVAIEYAFWSEKLPVALVRIGQPEHARALAADAGSDDELTAMLESRLALTMDALQGESVRRDPSHFASVLSGRSGVSPVYDLWRKLRAGFRGEEFRAGHGSASLG